jgi:hypothetical protein
MENQNKIKTLEYGTGIKQFGSAAEMYDRGFHDGATLADSHVTELVQDVQSLQKRVSNLQKFLEGAKLDAQEYYQRAWEDGYNTHASDAFHGKTTEFKKSDFYKEINHDSKT